MSKVVVIGGGAAGMFASDEYQVYSSDELNPVNDKMSLKRVERKEDE